MLGLVSPSNWVRLRLPVDHIKNITDLVCLAVIVFYSALAIEYFIRYHLRAPIYRKNKEIGVQNGDHSTGKLRLMSYTLIFSTMILLIR